jgi:hypothetical protein
MATVNFVETKRREAWVEGRRLRDDLAARYCDRYDLTVAPPPALIIPELLTDFLGFRLEYRPLPRNVHAQTEWVAGETIITANSNAPDNVKDRPGVEAVALWHEGVHGVFHGPSNTQQQPMLDGFDAPARIICYRGLQPLGVDVSREFVAEEAGRAAAVSYAHLRRSPWFERLLALAGKSPQAGAWRCLYGLAEDIHVNVSALVTQLQHESWIVVEGSGPGSTVFVQPSLSKELLA